jgi:hypothetical protein
VWRAWLAARGRQAARIGWSVGRIGVLVGLLSVVVAIGAYAVTRLHGQYGSGQAVVDTRTWALRTASYSGSSCSSCHADQASARLAGPHDTLTCEACHGPQGDHPASASGSVAWMQLPTSALCITCHGDTAGRPSGFPEIDPVTHYAGSGGECVRCHEPHAVIAVAPPDVTHPLANLPACTVCHAPNGLKKLPAGHEMVSDAVCLSCHAVPGRDS